MVSLESRERRTAELVQVCSFPEILHRKDSRPWASGSAFRAPNRKFIGESLITGLGRKFFIGNVPAELAAEGRHH